jgi:hypothetical protein
MSSNNINVPMNMNIPINNMNMANMNMANMNMANINMANMNMANMNMAGTNMSGMNMPGINMHEMNIQTNNNNVYPVNNGINSNMGTDATIYTRTNLCNDDISIDDDYDNVIDCTTSYSDYYKPKARTSKSTYHNIKGKHNHEKVIIDDTIIPDTTSTTNIGTVNNYNYNNYVQVVCIGPKDDYFQILSDRMGPDKAREYILNCAKNNLEGDINLIKTIYFDGKKPSEYPIKFLDKARNKVEFVNENQEKVIDPIGVELAKRLCSNLQNGYLVQVNIILECNLTQKNNGKFLDEFDLYNCQNHIYELSSNKYRAKLLKALPY